VTVNDVTNGHKAIVVAVDGSDASARAVDVAGDLASRMGDHVLLIHVREEELTPRGSAGAESPETADQLLEVAVKTLNSRGLNAASKVVAGVASADDVADAIVHQAELASAEYIVTGTRARSAVGKLILGSVAHKLIRTAECPVVVVR
jgi:nucleotide-binding universal stress UspA family protein